MGSTRALAVIPALMLLLWAPPASAINREPVHRAAIATIASSAESILVVRLDPEPMPRCFWDYTDSLRFTHCHELLEAAPSPGKEWNEDLGYLLGNAKLYAWNGDGCGYDPQAIVRFIASRGTSDLVVLTGKCDSSRVGLLLIRPDAGMEYREIGAPGADLLDMLEYALEQTQGSKVVTGEPIPDGAPSPDHRELPENTFVYYDQEPTPITRVEPVYPEFGEMMGLHGRVMLHALVGVDGLVKRVKVIHGEAGLNEAAITAVQKWQFQPAMAKGRPVEVWIEIPMDFNF